MSPPTAGRRAALILLDFQNEFAKEGGKLHDSVKDVMASNGMLDKVPVLLGKARDSGALVIHAPVVMKTGACFEEADYDPHSYCAMDGLFTEGTWNCKFVEEMLPEPGEEVLSGRNDFCAFCGTELAATLRINRVRTVVICGFLSNVCIEETASACRDEFPGLEVVICSDGCAAKTKAEHDNAMAMTLPVHGCKIMSCSDAAKVICTVQTSVSDVEGDFIKNKSLSQEKKGPNQGGGARPTMRRLTMLFQSTWFQGNATATRRGGQGQLRPGNENAHTSATVDSLFSFFGQSEGSGAPKAIKASGLAAALRIIGEEDVERALEDIKSKADKGGGDDFALTREQLIGDVFAAQIERTFREKVAIFVLIWLLPLLYSASTRLPFIFLALEMTQARGGELWMVGVVLGSYQMCRALGNFVIARYGGGDSIRRLHLFMITIGLMGWIFSNDLIFPSFNSTWNLLALCAVGFSESVVNLQTALVAETKAESRARITNPTVLSVRMRCQYAGVSGGAFFAFILGGALYTSKGLGYVCYLGAALHVSQMILTCFFLYCRMHVPEQQSVHLSSDPTHELDPLASIQYRIEAVKVILECMNDISVGAGIVQRGDSAQSVRNAMSHKDLSHSLALLYDAIFTRPRKQQKGSSKREHTARSKLHHFLEFTSGNTVSGSNKCFVNSVVREDIKMISDTAVKLMGSGDGQEVKKMEFVVFLAPLVYSRVHGDASAESTEVDVVWPYLKYIIITQAVMALCIGTFLSTALLMYVERFDYSAAQVGVLLGIGEGLGAAMLFVTPILKSRLAKRREQTNQEHGNSVRKVSLLRSIFAQPLHVPAILFLVSSATMGFAIPVLPVAIATQMVMSTANDFSVSLLNELIATSIPDNLFRKNQGRGQWLRRIGNTITGVTGPMLFSIDEGLPFLFFGGILFIWAILVFNAIYRQAAWMESKSEETNLSQKESHDGCCSILKPFGVTIHTPWSMLERRFYAANREEIREEILPGDTFATMMEDFAIETRLRKIGAALHNERSAQAQLEERVRLMEESTKSVVVEVGKGGGHHGHGGSGRASAEQEGDDGAAMGRMLGHLNSIV